jgi:hypothetical protein
MICDCGGGTVDITTYTVGKIEPKPAFEEACVGKGTAHPMRHRRPGD